MSSKSQKLKDLAMQAHIDNELDKSSRYTQQNDNNITPHVGNPANQQVDNTTSQLASKQTTQQYNKPLYQHVGNPAIQQTNNTVTQQVDNTISQYVGNPATQQVLKIKKTVYLDEDLQEILKLIKFLHKIDESKFVNLAIENEVIKTLGENWKVEYKQYLKNS